MDFSDINWLAIGIATLANMVVCFLFFESSLLIRWTGEFVKDFQKDRDTLKRYSAYLAYSFFLAMLLSGASSELADDGTEFLFVLAGLLLLVIDLFAPIDYTGREFRARIIFLFSSVLLAQIVVTIPL